MSSRTTFTIKRNHSREVVILKQRNLNVRRQALKLNDDEQSDDEQSDAQELKSSSKEESSDDDQPLIVRPNGRKTKPAWGMMYVDDSDSEEDDQQEDDSNSEESKACECCVGTKGFSILAAEKKGWTCRCTADIEVCLDNNWIWGTCTGCGHHQFISWMDDDPEEWKGAHAFTIPDGQVTDTHSGVTEQDVKNNPTKRYCKPFGITESTKTYVHAGPMVYSHLSQLNTYCSLQCRVRVKLNQPVTF